MPAHVRGEQKNRLGRVTSHVRDGRSLQQCLKLRIWNCTEGAPGDMGEDFGQTGGSPPKNPEKSPDCSKRKPDSFVLELGCGSGGYALNLAENIGCRVVGLDANAPGVRNATQLAANRGACSTGTFRQCDASKYLPLNGESSMPYLRMMFCLHLPGRSEVLGEMLRVLKPGGRMFMPLVVNRNAFSPGNPQCGSSIGFYVYSPPGKNELMEQAGFRRRCA